MEWFPPGGDSSSGIYPGEFTVVRWRGLRGCANGGNRARARPNVLVILADDLGYAEHRSVERTAYGYSHAEHRYDCQKMACGLRRGYVSCPVCSPTRAGFLNGAVISSG